MIVINMVELTPRKLVLNTMCLVSSFFQEYPFYLWIPHIHSNYGLAISILQPKFIEVFE